MSGWNSTAQPLVTVHLSVRGQVPADAVAYAQERLCSLLRRVPGRVVTALIVLDLVEVASSEAWAGELVLIEASFDADGTVVRDHTLGCVPRETIDRLVRQLANRVDHVFQPRWRPTADQ